MKKRTFHQRVRLVYRACRKLYGTEKTHDECLRIFKVVFPDLVRLQESEAETDCIPADVRNGLYKIMYSWNATGELEKLIYSAECWIEIPMESSRTEIIQFYEDILPVKMRIRKLSPRECFRLMDVSDEDIALIMQSGVSNSNCYKLAGNSICENVLYNIFRKLFVEKEPDINQGEPIQLKLF